MHKSLLLLIAAIASSSCFAATFSFPGPSGPFGVGLHVVQLHDTSRTYASKVDLVSGTAVPGDRTRT